MSAISHTLPITVDVTYSVEAPTRGHHDRFGAPEEPDDPGGVGDVVVTYNGHNITDLLTEDDYETIVTACEDDVVSPSMDADASAEDGEPSNE